MLLIGFPKRCWGYSFTVLLILAPIPPIETSGSLDLPPGDKMVNPFPSWLHLNSFFWMFCSFPHSLFLSPFISGFFLNYVYDDEITCISSALSLSLSFALFMQMKSHLFSCLSERQRR